MSRVMESPMGGPARNGAAAFGRPWIWVAGALVAGFGALVALYLGTAASMAGIWWRSETYAHGFVILPLSLYMVWTRRAVLARITPAPTLLPLVLLAAVVAGWTLAELVDVSVVRHLALVAMSVLLTVTLIGWRAAWLLSFPLAYLFFAVPMGGDLEPLLMDFTAVFTVDLLRLTGIPVYVEGRFLTLPTGHWEVAEACSGIRYLIASVALGTLYAFLTYHRIWKRVVFIGLSILVPILANGLRAYGIVMLGHLSDMKVATGVDHIIYGWFFFGIVMLLLFWLGSFFRDDDPAPAAESPVGADSAQVRDAFAGGRLMAALAGFLLIAALGPAGVWALEQRAPGPVADLAFPPAAPGWSGPHDPAPELAPVFPGASVVAQRTYRDREGSPVTVLAVHYRAGVEGAELISYENRLYDDERWLRFGASRHAPGVGPGLVGEYRLGRGDERHLLWWWYDIGDRRLVSRYAGKLHEAWAAVSGADRGSMLVAVSTPRGAGTEEARQRLRDFMAAHEEGLRARTLVGG